MPEIIFTTPFRLEKIEPLEVISPDPILIREVNKALGKLSDNLRQVIIQKISMGMTVQQIALANGLTERQAKAAIYEAMRQLRCYLSDFVYQRWGVKFNTKCRICEHPKQGVIDKMLQNKRRGEPWGSFGRRLSKQIGERFSPPRILITHLNHLNASRDESAYEKR